MRVVRGQLALLFIAGALATIALPAAGDPQQDVQSTANEVVGTTWDQSNLQGSRAGNSRRSQVDARKTAVSESKYTYLPKDQYKSQIASYRKSLAAAIAANRTAVNAREQCINSSDFNCGRFQAVALPNDPNIRQAADPADPAPAAPAISPEEAAYVATARLRLTPPKPIVGPPPEINQWNMAAVGYPLWLWADGNLNPAPVSDSVMDLSVALKARLVKVVFDMGDGHRVQCTNFSTQWTRAVEPGTPSPACGYAYQEPSLPEGSYTITAHTVWAVDWTINGTAGTIPFYQEASTQLPVGELQVLVR